METSLPKKSKSKKVWIIIAIIFVIYLIYSSLINTPNESRQIKSFDTPPSISEFVSYSDPESGIEMLMPTTPEKRKISLIGVTHYQSAWLVDENNFVQYNVSYSDDGLSDPSVIQTYMDNYIEGKLKGANDPSQTIRENINFNGSPAISYTFTTSQDDNLVKNKGIIFVKNGQAITVSVNFLNEMDENLVHFDSFVTSVLLKK